MTVVPFRVLVLDASGVHPEQILELQSELTFLDKLYYLDVEYEYAWVQGQDHHAEILIDGEPNVHSPYTRR